MTKNHQENTITGSSAIPEQRRRNSGASPSREAAEPDTAASSQEMMTVLENITDLTGPQNTTYSGMRGNIITYLSERQDRVADQLNTKIDRLDRRLSLLEEQGRERP